MSVWNAGGSAAAKVTVPGLMARKQAGTASPKISAVTAYDYPGARLADAAGLDLVLVGDSLAMTMLGLDSTLAVTLDEMLVFTRAVRRGLTRALLVADMPFGSYHVSPRQGVRSALRFLKEAGAEAVKLEGGRERVALIRRLVEAGIPVLGHLGLTPQALHRMGGYKVQAKSDAAIATLREDARSLAAAGCFALVLEGIPREVAAQVTAELPIPTIGIGAGPDCDGQVMVWHDLLGLTARPAGAAPARFVRSYLDGATLVREALERFRHDVESGNFPSDAESYHLPQAQKAHQETPAHAGA